MNIANEPRMLLEGVEDDSKPSVYRDLIDRAKLNGGDSWQIWNLLAFDPEAAHHLAALSHKLMHEPAPLSSGFRELIAAYTSSLNNCEFCMKAHAAVASELLEDSALVWSVLSDPETAPIEEKNKSLLRFVRKVTLAPSFIGSGDIEQLHIAGWDDAAIFYAMSACALFNFYNRWVMAGGVNIVSNEVFTRLGSRMAKSGYNRSAPVNP